MSVQKISRNPKVSFTQISDQEIVILNPEDENFYHLNQSAVDLWLALDTPKTTSELCALFSEKYVAPSEGYTYEEDISNWIWETKQRGLLLEV